MKQNSAPPQTTNLKLVLHALEQLHELQPGQPYFIPRLWNGGNNGFEQVQPGKYFADIINNMFSGKASEISNPLRASGNWTPDAVVYNLFIRLTTAYDHNNDGIINTEPLENGFRETGSLLKAIGLLPYIKKLGVNTLYLLPVTLTGCDEKKGSLGSPYAVKDPFTIDPMLDEPALGLSADILLKAFVEAAHLLNMRVLFEFVFRTASVDNNWIQKHPDWFYWISESECATKYCPPHFSDEILNTIYEKVDKHDLKNLPSPEADYKNMFTSVPVIINKKNGKLRGLTKQDEECRIASAFSDWPPDDRQPPWTDVTYLKMHNHPKFNYIAYNTIRMYDVELDNPEYRNNLLWETIESIIPHFQDNYLIDGAMIDMGHALPSELKYSIVKRARRNDPDFAFWDENFDPTPSVRDEGFNAVFGSLPFVIHDPVFIRGLLNYLNKTGVALPFFGTGENHNTPRVCHNYPGLEAGRNRSSFIFTLCCILPSIPFLHSGMELCEWHPVNLGLNFTAEDRERFTSDKLPLFSAFSYDWKTANGLETLNSYISKILTIREQYRELVQCLDKGSIILPYITNPELLAVMRKNDDTTLLFIGNSNGTEEQTGVIEFGIDNAILFDLIEEKKYPVSNHSLTLHVKPGQSMLFELPFEKKPF
jgi:starch synthase (maltosyl-transferring)